MTDFTRPLRYHWLKLVRGNAVNRVGCITFAVVCLFGVPALADEGKEKLKKALENFREPSIEKQLEEIAARTDIGGWWVTERISPMTDFEELYYMLPAESPVGNSFGIRQTPILALRCRDYVTDFTILWNRAIHLFDEEVTVRWRKDKNNPEIETWQILDKTATGLYRGAAIERMRSWEGMDRLVVQVPVNENKSVMAVFMTGGFDEVIGNIEERCKWAPPESAVTDDATEDHQANAEQSKPEQEEDRLSSILKNIEEMEQQKAKQSSSAEDHNLSSMEPTQKLAETIQAQIARCWRIDAGAQRAEDLVVPIRVQLARDGSLRRTPEIQNTSRMNNDRYYRKAAENARRAISECQPFDLPSEDYALWSDMILNFNPREMF
ncbi:type VI secretion system-associated protein TagO [Fodinicurvata sediminis]|uniref:type VI secretion system-associated protein TagO n=1 Tax=Fodinicurvata sediminis TaxID=1121832 RepID=UPI00040CFD08|nr:type VI secretion system-associated protein TagO [Fodinicurvata sediminis]